MVGPSPVPWLNVAGGGQARPFTVPGVTACPASDLSVRVHVADPSYVGGGPKDVTWWVIDVADAGPAPCFVGSSPEVSFYASGASVPVPRGAPFSGDIVYLTPDAAAPAPFFATASGEIDVNGCVLSGVDRVLVDFGGDLGSVAVAPGPAAGWGAACPVAGETYFSELYGVPANGSRGGRLAATQTLITAPATAAPGEDLDFLVTLVNAPAPHSELFSPTNPTLTLDPCPAYHEELEGIPGAFHSYRLDCAAAVPIPPGGSETFAMSVQVPGAAPPGPTTLAWSIDGSPQTYQIGRSYLEIA